MSCQSEESQLNLLCRNGNGSTETSSVLKVSHATHTDLRLGCSPPYSSLETRLPSSLSSMAQFLRNRDHISHFPSSSKNRDICSTVRARWPIIDILLAKAFPPCWGPLSDGFLKWVRESVLACPLWCLSCPQGALMESGGGILHSEWVPETLGYSICHAQLESLLNKHGIWWWQPYYTLYCTK